MTLIFCGVDSVRRWTDGHTPRFQWQQWQHEKFIKVWCCLFLVVAVLLAIQRVEVKPWNGRSGSSWLGVVWCGSLKGKGTWELWTKCFVRICGLTHLQTPDYVSFSHTHSPQLFHAFSMFSIWKLARHSWLVSLLSQVLPNASLHCQVHAELLGDLAAGDLEESGLHLWPCCSHAQKQNEWWNVVSCRSHSPSLWQVQAGTAIDGNAKPTLRWLGQQLEHLGTDPGNSQRCKR